MRDEKSSAQVTLLHPAIRDEVKMLLTKAESIFPPTMAIRVVQGLRTIEQQNAIYAQGRTKPGAIVSNARGGSSYHNYGLAIDFCILLDKNGDGKYEEMSWDINADNNHDSKKDWFQVIDVFKHAGYESGADWKSIKDYPHLQKTFGLSWRELYKRYLNKNFIPGTQYVKL